MDKQSLLDMMSQEGLPIKTPFGSIMEYLGIPKERLVDILSGPFLTLGKYPYPVPEQNVRPLASAAATMLPYEITPQEMAFGALFGGPKVGDFIEFNWGGKTIKGKVRDIDPYSKEAWVFPEDRSIVTNKEAATVTVPFDKIKSPGEAARQSIPGESITEQIKRFRRSLK